jgi:rubrerythrin
LPAKKKKMVKKAQKKTEMSAAEGLAIAIQTELEGYEFYRMAAAKCQDDGAKRMFESLAKDEVEHQRILKKQYDSVMKGGDFVPPKKPARSRFKVKSPVFSKAFLESKKKKQFEMSALSVGVLLEQNAIDFYNKQGKRSRTPKAKEFFKELSNWEGEHLRALLAQKQFLQREIFAAAHFEPF